MLVFLSQVVLFDNVFRKERKGDTHVFVSVKWRAEIKILDIHAHVLCKGSAHYTVPKDFGR